MRRKKKNKSNNSFFKKNIFLFLMFFSCLFLCIGYANVDDINLNVNGLLRAEIQPGLFISNVNVSANDTFSSGKSSNYSKTMMNTDITLSENKNASVTFEVTLHNNSTITYVFDKATPDKYDEDFYDNKYITYEISSELKNGDKIDPGDDTTFTITFKYIDNLNFDSLPEDFSNILNTYINFNFTQLQHVVLGDNLLIYDNAIINSYVDVGGNLVSYDGWTSSDYIDISNYKYLIIYSNLESLEQWNAVYDENYNYIKNLSLNSSKVKHNVLGEFKTSLILLKVEDNHKYLRVSSNTSFFNSIKIYPVTNPDFNGVIDLNLEQFQVLVDEYVSLYNKNDNTLNSYVLNSNGNIVGYTGWQSSDYIDVSNYKKILISNTSSKIGGSWNAFYDSDKKFVKSLNISNYTKYYNSKYNYYIYLTIPDNVHYIRLSEANSIMSGLSIYPMLDFDYDSNLPGNLVVGDNLYTTANINNVYISSSTGEEISYSGWSASDFIELTNDEQFIIIGENNILSTWNAAYDENKNFVHGFSCSRTKVFSKDFGNQTATLCIFNRKNNVKYIRLSEETSSLKNIKVFPIVNKNFNGVLSVEFLNK